MARGRQGEGARAVRVGARRPAGFADLPLTRLGPLVLATLSPQAGRGKESAGHTSLEIPIPPSFPPHIPANFTLCLPSTPQTAPRSRARLARAVRERSRGPEKPMSGTSTQRPEADRPTRAARARPR